MMESVNSDGWRCQNCTMMIWGGNVHTCAGQRMVTLPESLQQTCSHCYCRTTHSDTAGPAHRICCNCGNRQAMGTY